MSMADRIKTIAYCKTRAYFSERDGQEEKDDPSKPDSVSDSVQMESGEDHREQNNLPSGGGSGGAASFPVNLSREEYIRFNLIVSKTAGMLRLRKGQTLLFSIMIGICLFMLYTDMMANHKVDDVTIVFMVLLVVVEGLILYGVPAYVRRSAGQMYEQTMESGHSYYGIITVYPDRMEKRSVQNTVTIRYQQEAVYIETRDMMILMAPNTPAIVLPARCMTQANADEVRRAVLQGVLPPRQQLIERMIPAASAPIVPPEDTDTNGKSEEEDTLMELDVNYTREEFIKLALTGALHSYMKALPAYCLAAIVTGLLMGFLYNFGIGMITFLLMQALFFAVYILGARGKAAKLFGAIPEGGSHIHIRFTDRGLIMRSYKESGTIQLAWTVITRAVERPDSVEFYTKTALLDIPKRCIDDMNALRKIVDAHHQTPEHKDSR